MSNNENTTDLFIQELQNSRNTINFKDLLYMCLGRWPWFVLSVLVAVGIATLYILRTPPVYNRSASLLIKEDSKGQSVSSDVSSMFSEMGLTRSNTNVNNELISLQSPALMLDVVKRLHLDVDYLVAGTFHDETLYGSSLPVSVSFDGIADNATVSFRLQVSAGGKVVLTDMECGDGSVSMPERLEGKLNATFSTPLCKIKVAPSPHYKKGTEYPEIEVRRTSLYSATDHLKGSFTASLNSDDATVVDLAYQDVSIQRAEDVLNTLISVYNENWVKDKNQVTVSTSQFITDRLGVIERELGDVDENISSYKSRNLIPDADAASNMYMSQSQTTTNQILATNTQISMARYIRQNLLQNAGKNQLLPANSGLESASIEQQISEYNAKQLQRNNLVSNSSEQNPLVIDLDQSLAALRRAIVVSIDNLITSLNTQLAGLQGSEQRTNARIASNPTQAKYLQTVGRQQKVKESLYLFLLQKREENELSQAFTAYNTRLITPPSGNFIPVAPKRGKIVLMAFLIGLIVPAVVIAVRENSNTTVRGRKDLGKLSMPFAGEIPQFSSDGKKKKWNRKRLHAEPQAVVVRKDSRDMINEAFRVLRTNIEFMLAGDTRSNVVVITSFNPGSGKTFITMNVATSLAIKGKRVLVIDGDMRRASSSMFVGRPKIGLSNYLAGTVKDIHDVIVNYEGQENLFVLPVGTFPPNPTELLFSERFGELISRVRGDFDYVLIDCPPIEIVADTQIIEKQADRTLFVVRAGLLERSMLPELNTLYTEKKFKSLSVILNGTDSGMSHYGHRYGYRYGYKYGYHYGYYGHHGKNYYNA